MTAQTAPIPLPMLPPCGLGWSHNSSSVGSNTTLAFNGAGDKIAWVFQAQSTTPPDQVSFHIGTVTTAGTAGAIEATLETLDTSGLPSGTPVTNSATGSSTISTTGYKNITGMAGTASLTVGAFYAVVLTAGSGWDRNITMTVGIGGASTTTGLSNPYALTKDSAGAWTKQTVCSGGWCVGLRNSSGTRLQLPGLVGAAHVTNSVAQSFSNSTNPDERGNRFTLPFPATLIGVAVGGTASGGGTTTNDDGAVSLYSSPTSTPNQLETLALEGEVQASGMAHIYYFDTAVALSANTEYCIAYKAKGTETYSMMMWEYEANADLAWMLGTGFYSMTRDGGNPGPDNPGNNFTAGDNKVYAIFPIFSAFDDGTGSGGTTIAGTPMRRGMV